MKLLDTIVGLTLALAVLCGWAGTLYASLFVLNWGVWFWAAPLAIALQCWLFVGMFIVAHDAIHGTLSPALPGLNSLIGAGFVLVYAGFRYETLAAEHHAHHRHAGTAADPDFHAEDPRAFWPWYVAFFRNYFGWREFTLIAGAAIALAIILGPKAPLLLVFWALPAILSSVQLFYFGTYLPHRHGSDTFSDRHNARGTDQPWLISLLACFHFGHHHAHHAMPWVPWWRLPSARTKEVTP